MSHDRIPVLIIGGGPVGLSASLCLARLGVPSLLIERHSGTSIHPRARGLNVRTMEIYRELGLQQAIQTAGSALANSRYMLFVETLAGKEIRRVPDDDLMLLGERLAALTPCTWCQCAQDELEPLLLAATQKWGSTVQFGTEMVSVTQDAQGVTATVIERETGVEHTIQAEYLIATDGAKSPIRHVLEIPMRGQGTLEHFINIYFRADLRDLVRDRWFGICFVENTLVQGIFLAVNNTDRWLFNVSYTPEEGKTPADFTIQRCIDLVRQAVGLPELAVEIISILPWEATARVVDYMQVGRVFLAGDAAHLMPPAGGFGLNTGVQDVHNLAWKLAAVLNGVADAALLKTYNLERQPVAKIVVDQAVQELNAPTPDTVGNGRQGGPPSENDDVELLDQLIPVLGYQYASNAILVDEQYPQIPEGLALTGRPGTRAPHVWLIRQGERISTLDLFGIHFVLLIAEEGEVWETAAREAASGLHLSLDIYSVGEQSDLVDVDQRWNSAYGVTSLGAVLVRPDGFVCWRNEGRDEHPPVFFEHVLKRILHQTP